MKKNKMMRIASFLLVAVLMSTCAISGTFAKYVTSDTASDTARVAKWGVVVSADGSLFSNTYLTTTNTPGGADGDDNTGLSVESSDGKVVAPGTKNTDGITFSITGTPEVDVSIAVTLNEGNKRVFLKDGTYEDMTTGDTDTYPLGSVYEPIKFTLTQTKENGSAETKVNKGTFADLTNALNAIADAHVDANTNLGEIYGTYTITWEWATETDDKADTILGSIAAGTYTGLTEGTDYCLTAFLGFTITVTQID